MGQAWLCYRSRVTVVPRRLVGFLLWYREADGFPSHPLHAPPGTMRNYAIYIDCLSTIRLLGLLAA